MFEIVLEKDGVFAQTERKGRLYRRLLSAEEFRKAALSAARFDTGLLPANTRFFRRRAQHIVLAVEIPAAKRRIRTGWDGNENTYEGCAMPAGVFFFKLFENMDRTYTVVRAEIAATKRAGLMGMNTSLHHYPVPNNTSDICWGEDSTINTALRSMSAVEGIVSSFFSTRFNSELGAQRVSAKFPKFEHDRYDEMSRIKGYFQELTKHAYFDDKWLPASGNRKFETTLNRFLGAAANTDAGGEVEEEDDYYEG